jgi:predicted NUDIX family phosphoesterase
LQSYYFFRSLTVLALEKHKKGIIVAEEKHLEEHVLVVPAKLLKAIGVFQGLSFEMEKYTALLDSQHHTYMRRKEAENNPEFKQLIPYALMRCGEMLFAYRRGKLQGEKRLIGNYSLGVGGHISIDDPTLFGSSYHDGLLREVNEEVVISSPHKYKVVGLINDDSNEVGKVHLGIVHIFDLVKPLVAPKEKSINETKFLNKAELVEQKERFENWSQICIDNIDVLLK